jgi:Sporulation and spore germination/Immunoglobulin-like domain of bacterial spore germination
VTRHRLITSVTGAVTLGAALGLLASSCVADGSPGVSRRQVATPPLTRSDERAVDRTVAAPDARLAAARGPMAVTVYYLRPVGSMRYLAPERHQVPFVPSVDGEAASAVTELLEGRPSYLGAARPFPAGTHLLGLDLEGRTATVNLSREALGAASGDGYPLQALVWTVTQLPRVKQVVVEVEGRSTGTLGGRPLAGLLGAGGRQLVRDRGARLAPILLVEPAPRASVDGSRVVARGQARVAAGTVGLRLHDQSGQVVSQSYAALPSSAPAWGAFSGALTFVPPPKPQLWTLEAFEASPTGASVTYSVAVPVWVGR